jgi:hypothetical protein
LRAPAETAKMQNVGVNQKVVLALSRAPNDKDPEEMVERWDVTPSAWFTHCADEGALQ